MSCCNVDFRNTIIVLTSNVGTRQLQEFGAGIGFGAQELDAKRAHDTLLKALQKQFPPEFVNRIDNVVTFDALSRDTITRIVRYEVSLLQQRLKAQGHQLTVSAQAPSKEPSRLTSRTRSPTSSCADPIRKK